MARGIHQFNSAISTATDTSLVAAPGAGQWINIRWITIDVLTSEASSKVLIEDGAGGNVIATCDCSDDNNRIERVYHVGDGSRGYQLTENTALNADTNTGFTGTAVIHVNGEYEVT